LSGHGTRASRPRSRPSQSRSHGESGQTRSGDSQAAPEPSPQAKRTHENSKTSSAGIWAVTLAWLRYEYDLIPALVKIGVVVVLLVIVITSFQNIRSKQTAPESEKTPVVTSAPKPLSGPQVTVVRPGLKDRPESHAGAHSRETPARTKAIAKLEPPSTSREESWEHQVSPRLPSALDRPELVFSNLSPEDQAWVTRSCPRSLGPSLWNNCVRREVNALSRGRPDLSNLKTDERNWVLRSCPSSLGPSLVIACLNRELQALAGGMPNLSALGADERAWIQQSCPQSLGPSLYRSCVSREARAVTGGKH